MPRKIYWNPADYIREERFEVRAPTFYHPDMSSDSVVLKKEPKQRINPFMFVTTRRMNPTPFRMDVDAAELQNCSYTIQTMLDLFRKKIEFHIVQDHDVVAIFDALDRYLASLRHDVQVGVENSIEWARLVVSFRQEVYKDYYRYMKLNPAAMEELYPALDTNNNIFTLMAAITGVTQSQLKSDPLSSRARPPFDIDALKPKPAPVPEKKEEDDKMTETYGINKYRQPVDDGGTKWDFDGFMKGGS